MMCGRLAAAARRRLRSERGAFTAMVVGLLVMLLVVAGLVVDAGFLLNARAQTYDDVEQAARAGANQINEDALRLSGQIELLPSAEATAENFMWNLGRQTEDADRGGYSSVSAHVEGTSVIVEAERDVPTRLLTLIGIDSLHVEAEATADAEFGIEAPF